MLSIFDDVEYKTVVFDKETLEPTVLPLTKMQAIRNKESRKNKSFEDKKHTLLNSLQSNKEFIENVLKMVAEVESNFGKDLKVSMLASNFTATALTLDVLSDLVEGPLIRFTTYTHNQPNYNRIELHNSLNRFNILPRIANISDIEEELLIDSLKLSYYNLYKQCLEKTGDAPINTYVHHLFHKLKSEEVESIQFLEHEYMEVIVNNQDDLVPSWQYATKPYTHIKGLEFNHPDFVNDLIILTADTIKSELRNPYIVLTKCNDGRINVKVHSTEEDCLIREIEFRYPKLIVDLTVGETTVVAEFSGVFREVITMEDDTQMGHYLNLVRKTI